MSDLQTIGKKIWTRPMKGNFPKGDYLHIVEECKIQDRQAYCEPIDIECSGFTEWSLCKRLS